MNQKFDNVKAQIQNLINFIYSQFKARTLTRKKGEDDEIEINIESKKNILWITFFASTQSYSINIPLPFIRDGVILISQNEVERSLCTYFFEETQTKADYISAMYYIFFEDPAKFITDISVKKTPFIQQIVYSFENGNTSTIIYNLQRIINKVVNGMPLHQSQLSSWVMNHRLLVVDPKFDSTSSPEDRLKYQVNKAEKYFDVGWTSLGLSDGSLADKNYILTTDIRKLTPFSRFHNPGRNLFSALKMRGNELPLIRSESMQNLMNEGITRTGWNWFTAFVDIPDNFEDQIMLDRSLLGIPLVYEKRIQCFGEVIVKEGEVIKYNQPLCILPDEETTRFGIIADKAVVEKITEATTNVGNVPTKMKNVIIKYTRKLKEGFKITNAHGNKGVVRFTNLGYAIDPRNGKERKINVMVSAKSIKKRKNYGQLLEALLNNIHGDTEAVVSDDFVQSMSEIHNSLKEKGFRKDGTWDCDTYVGKFKAICGTVFWGVIESVEDTIWDHNETIRKNGKELRNAGLKFSHIEIRAFETRFGPDNPIVDEIMTYAQGAENLHEQLDIMRSKIGILPKGKPVVDIKNVKPVDQSGGTIVAPEMVLNTIVDENYIKDGFILKLPIIYQVLIDKEDEVIYEGPPQHINPEEIDLLYNKVININKLYIPSGTLRRCWKHPTGKLGLNEIGVIINNIVVLYHRYIADPQKPINFTFLYRTICTYFNKITEIMSTKRGDISVYGMSVRYPLSAKGRATLSNTLSKNTIEIHSSVADKIHVKSGDVVLVERFPCLGFMSVRPQKVRVTNDPQCKYVIRVSKNSLGSLSLDFDGDVIFIASFHSKESKILLKNEHTNPNKTCYRAIQLLNKKAGTPHIKSMNLFDYKIVPFEPLNNKTHSNHVKNLTGVKAQTGPVVALTYNVMRLIENSGLKRDRKFEVAIEIFLDKVANSVFAQKHGELSLHDIVLNSICIGDVKSMVNEGFNKDTTTTICDIIRKKAATLGVFNLVEYHERAKKAGRGNIINRIIRSENRIYYASRANLECTKLLTALEAPAVDVPSRLLKWIMSGKIKTVKTQLESLYDKRMLTTIHNTEYKNACITMLKYVENTLLPIKTASKYKIISDKLSIRKLRKIKEINNYVKSAKRR